MTRLMNLIVACITVCFCGCASVSGIYPKTIDLTAVQWVTQDPPGAEELDSSVRVVEFWATWCLSCKSQIGHMNSLTKKYKDRDVIFIGIAGDSSADTVRRFVEKKKINYHIGMDNGLSYRLGVTEIPMVFVIGREGKVLWGGNPGSWDFENALKQAIQGQS